MILENGDGGMKFSAEPDMSKAPGISGGPCLNDGCDRKAIWIAIPEGTRLDARQRYRCREHAQEILFDD